MFCRECGAPHPDEAKFCDSCGKSLTSSTRSTSRVEPEIVKRQFPISSEIPTLATLESSRRASDRRGDFHPTISENDSSSPLGKYLGILVTAVVVIAMVVFALKYGSDSDTTTNNQPEPHRANVTIHPYDLVKDPYRYKNDLVVLNVIERPMVSNGSVIEYSNIVAHLNSGVDPEAAQLGLLGLRFNRMASDDTALFDVMAAATDFYASSDAVVLGQIAVIVPSEQRELKIQQGWEVQPLGTVEGTNAFGGHLQVPLVRFWRYAFVSVALSSHPDGAEIYLNDSLIGNTPATLNLSPGKHMIRVSLSGYKDWVREVSAESGAKVNLIADLEKEN